MLTLADDLLTISRCISHQSEKNQIDKIESTKAWGKESFCNFYWCVHTSTYYLNIYNFFYFFKSIYASLNFHMCLQNMTPPKFLWVLCCVRYDKIVSVCFCFFFLLFFLFFFVVFFPLFSFCCIIFPVEVFFSSFFFSKVVFH